jgi:hypothetical protein
MDRSKLLEKYGFENEFVEVALDHHKHTGFPKPIKGYRLVYNVYDLTLEEPYFWVVNGIKEFMPYIEKLEDTYAASENSAFFGVSQQRLGAQQDKVSQFLATTGKMIKELFQMVRELRIINERLGYYDAIEIELIRPLGERLKSSDITLKGMFVDLVQGGGKSAASVYGMARELEFITLPDLFFDAPPFKNASELESYINGMAKDFNQNVLRVLLRHIRSYMEWKKRTHIEHRDRKRFMLKYLKQHFDIIQMYIEWIKPYLRHVQKLSLKGKNMDSADLIAAFDGSMVDIEILGRFTNPIKDTNVNGCMLVTFNYRTQPDMKFVGEGYQRGPVHTGWMEMNIRGYTWTDKELENYRKLKQEEGLQLMGDISGSVQEAMVSLGGELSKYLDEANEKETETKKVVPEKPPMMQRLFGDFYTPKLNKPSKVDKKKVATDIDIENSKKGLKSPVELMCWNTYKNFKKAHRMVQW